MLKIPTLFVRDHSVPRAPITRDVTPGCEWVLQGEGVSTRKYDGTCVMFDGRDWWARREVKARKTPPPGWVRVERNVTTGKQVGWEPIAQSPFVRIHHEAVAARTGQTDWLRGTYELLGPKINGNPERGPIHWLQEHSMAERVDAPRDFDGLRDWLGAHPYEGVVWHRSDGRMAKIKARDFPRGMIVTFSAAENVIAAATVVNTAVAVVKPFVKSALDARRERRAAGAPPGDSDGGPTTDAD